MADASTAKILLARLRSHNCSVAAASGATLVLVTFGWAILYVASYWAVMFVLTVAKAGDARLPASFHSVFFIACGVLLVCAAIDSWFFPDGKAVDERPAIETLADVLLFLPRLTITIVMNFAAWARLRRDLREDAADLIERMRLQRKIALTSLPITLPDERERDQILHTLLLLQVAEIRPERGELWLRLSPFAPAEFRDPQLTDSRDDISKMRRANAVHRPAAQLRDARRRLEDIKRSETI